MSGQVSPAAALPPGQATARASSDLVFVLCTSRSGSTLLRFVLDAHQDLACPPETRLPGVLAQLAGVWSATEALAWPRSKNAKAPVQEAAAAGVRSVVDQMIGPYLASRGKKRYCDKNLGTEQHAELLHRVFPEARFLCLYRHPMDMIASGIEASPWGLASYGFEQYASRAPGNSVHALARYWADHVGAILAIEEKFPASCHRVRYEDLVAEPDHVAGRIFEFLGVPPEPDISARAFSGERERSGPGDFKIWNTSEVSGESVGRGWALPANLIPAPVLTTVNELNDRLGYVRVDDNWGVAARPGDLRVPASGQLPQRSAGRAAASQPLPPGTLLVSERVRIGLRRLDDEFTARWQPHCQGVFLIISLASAAEDDSWWLVDLTTRRAITGTGICPDQAQWTVTAPAATWEQVIRDGTNLGVAFRRQGMRYRDMGDGGAGSVIADSRVAMMSDLLGIITWKAGSPSEPPPGTSREASRPAPAPALATANGPPEEATAAPVVAAGPADTAEPGPAWPVADTRPSAATGATARPAGAAAGSGPAAQPDAASRLVPPAGPAGGQRTAAGGQLGAPAKQARPAQSLTPAAPPGQSPAPQRADLDQPLWPAAGQMPGVAVAGSPERPAGQEAQATRPRVQTVRITAATGHDHASRVEPRDRGDLATEPASSPRPSSPARSGGKSSRPSAREQLQRDRARATRRRRRLRRITIGAGTAGVAVAVIIVSGLFRHDRPAAPPAASSGYAGPYAPVTLNADNSVTMSQPGVAGPVVDVYEDFQCAACRAFEEADGAVLEHLAYLGKVKVVYHPFTLDSAEPEQADSVRAWSAARCAPASLWVRYHNLLYASPAPAADGFTVTSLVRLGQEAGISSPGFGRCVQTQKFAVLDAPVSDEIINSGLGSLPALKLNGHMIAPGVSAAALQQQIGSAR